MKTLEIKAFGPIEKASIDLERNIQIFIGPQASGKSTICKIIYFCKKIRDYTLDFLVEEEQFKNNHPNEYYSNYLKYLTRQFMGCFGKTTHMLKFDVKYTISDNEISINLNKDGYVRINFNKKPRNRIKDLINDAAKMFAGKLEEEKIKSIFNRLSAVAFMKGKFREVLYKEFDDDSEIIYIPAGRNLLSLMPEHLLKLTNYDIDLTTREFINLIIETRTEFSNKIPEIVKEYTKTVKGQINNTQLDEAYNLIRKILKADYMYESDGEKIYFDDRHWVKLMYGSSGQQEALWILMLAFITILKKRKTFMVIEEPEAHLFPLAQRDIMSLISLMSNSTDSQVIITTHSPYILTAINVLLYSNKVESKIKREKQVVPRNIRVQFDKIQAYKVGDNDGKSNIESILDREHNMIDPDYIDNVSTLINEDLSDLIDMEIEDDLQ